MSSRRIVSEAPRSQPSARGSSTKASARLPLEDLPVDTSRTASPTPSTAVEKMISRPVKEDASTAVPSRKTLDDESRSSLPPTAQVAPLNRDCASPLPVSASAGPSFWRPGDRAKLAINKKMRDIEFFLLDGALRMRDSSTGNVLTDRQKKPKEDLPEFDRNLLYRRLEPSPNMPQDLSPGVGSSLRGSIIKDKDPDHGTSRSSA